VEFGEVRGQEASCLAAHVAETEGGFAVGVLRADGVKCERCWNFTTDVGVDRDWPGACARCAVAVRETIAGEGPA
jgi:isoleucyl-tRNA synthetase